MKKILKCLCLLLIVPIVSVFALTGCKEKNNNNNGPKAMTYADLKTVLNSAFTQLYGTDIPAIPPEEPEETPGEGEGNDGPVGEVGGDAMTPMSVSYGTASAASSNNFKVSNGNSIYDEIAKDTESFKTSTGAFVLAINNVSVDIIQSAKFSLNIARSLIYQNKSAVLNNTIIFSYTNQEELYPDQLDCKMKITVYKSSVLIECHTTSGGDAFESYFVNIEYNSKYEATRVMYCLGQGVDAEATPLASEEKGNGKDEPETPTLPTEMFCFAIYDIANDTSYTLDYEATNFAEYKAQLKLSMHTFRQAEGTADTSVNLATICKLITE